ncbi:MAG: Uma2 family endonuclease [Planctomycetaceae bacterium]
MAAVVEPQYHADVDTRVSLDEYVELERATGERHEFHDGKVVRMVGGSGPHSAIGISISAELYLQLKGTNRVVHGSDLRIALPTLCTYVYADCVIPDGVPQFVSPKDSLTNPIVIFEVLSPSTEAYDRGDKFGQYRTIETFREYLLVCQDRPHVEQFLKQDDGNWLLKEYNGNNAVITIESLGCQLSLADVYAKVDFTKAERTPVPESEKRV